MALATVRALCKQYEITMREVKTYVLERKPRAGKDGAVVAKKRVVSKTATGAKRGRPAKSKWQNLSAILNFILVIIIADKKGCMHVYLSEYVPLQAMQQAPFTYNRITKPNPLPVAVSCHSRNLVVSLVLIAFKGTVNNIGEFTVCASENWKALFARNLVNILILCKNISQPSIFILLL